MPFIFGVLPLIAFVKECAAIYRRVCCSQKKFWDTGRSEKRSLKLYSFRKNLNYRTLKHILSATSMSFRRSKEAGIIL